MDFSDLDGSKCFHKFQLYFDVVLTKTPIGTSCSSFRVTVATVVKLLKNESLDSCEHFISS